MVEKTIQTRFDSKNYTRERAKMPGIWEHMAEGKLGRDVCDLGGRRILVFWQNEPN
jgi:hypothetical protein